MEKESAKMVKIIHPPDLTLFFTYLFPCTELYQKYIGIVIYYTAVNGNG